MNNREAFHKTYLQFLKTAGWVTERARSV